LRAGHCLATAPGSCCVAMAFVSLFVSRSWPSDWSTCQNIRYAETTKNKWNMKLK
jgi:hypothetical protein